MILAYLFIIGAVIGSFLNVCIYRIAAVHLTITDEPKKLLPRLRWIFANVWLQLQSLWERPSQCPRCRTDIKWADNIPIFGWLKLGGRCRQCKMWISPRYPAIELLNALLWVVVFWMEVPMGWNATLSESSLFTEIGPQTYPGLDWMSPEFFVLARYLFHMILIEALLVASIIDLDHRVIPDATTVPFMFVGLIGSTVLGRVHLMPVLYHNSHLMKSFTYVTPEWLHPLMAGPDVPAWVSTYPHLHGFAVSLAGLLVGGGITLAVRRIGRWGLGKEAMGDGDVVLMAMMGAFLGWQPIVISFFVAAAVALLVVVITSPTRLSGMIAYGPYLSVGGVLVLLAWKRVWAQFELIFSLGVLLIPITAIGLLTFVGSLLFVTALKRLLGFSDAYSNAYWRAADQTWFFSGEKVDRHTGNWRKKDWDGCASGRGQIFEDRWRGR